MSRTSRMLLISLLIALTVGVLGYAVYATMEVQRGNRAARERVAEQAPSTVQPLNRAAPPIVAETLEPTGQRAQRGTIIFDMAHSEVFGPQDTGELGQSKAVERMRNAGYAVRVITERISEDTLSEDVAAVFLPGPMVPFTEGERTALDDFVRRGGTMILSVHVPFPILGTTARYGLPVGTGVMVDPSLQLDPGVWVTSAIEPDPVTESVKTLGVVSGWSVGVSPSEIADPRVVIQAPPSVIVDANNDGSFDSKDPRPPYGVVGVADIGSGRVVVLGDDAIFANIAIDTSDNAKLLDNLLELISAPRPT